MMIYDDDNGASLQPQDETGWPVARAYAVAFAFGAAFWLVIGAIVWLFLGEAGA